MKVLITNGEICSMDSNNDFFEALFVKDGIIQDLGSNEEMYKHHDADTILIDLDGKFMMPGFIDGHMHMVMFGANLNECNLIGVNSINSLIETVKSYIKANNIQPGEWVIGKGWNEDYFDKKILPNSEDIDKISLEHNICLTRGCYHMCVVNNNVLNYMGLNANNCTINGGKFDVNSKGELTGICREEAMKYVYSKLPRLTKESIKKNILTAKEYLLGAGITSVQSDDFMMPGTSKQDIIDAFDELRKEDSLSVKVYEQCLLNNTVDIEEFVKKSFRNDYTDRYFTIGPVKFLIDGNLGTRTALLNEAYADDPQNKGITKYSQDEIDSVIQFAYQNDIPFTAHAIGDQAIQMVVDAIDKLPQHLKRKDLRPILIHCQITNEHLIKKMKDLNIVASVQPIFLNYDIHMAESRIGQKRIVDSYNWKTMLSEGIKLSLGSDCPVELPDPLNGIYCAVTRKDLNGYPPGGWYPDECLSVDEALYGYTMGSAYAAFEEKTKGSLEIGKYADMIVLSENPLNIEKDDIKEIKVLMTFVDGNLVYKV